VRHQHSYIEKEGRLVLAQANVNTDTPANFGGGDIFKSPLDGAVWASVDGNIAKVDAADDGNTEEADFKGATLTVGFEGKYHDSHKAGMAFRAGKHDLDVERRNSHADITTYGIALYGASDIGERIHFMYGAAYAVHNLKTDRQLTLTAVPQLLKSEYDVHTADLFLEAGYTFDQGDWRVEPYVGFNWMYLSQDEFQEGGGTSALFSDEHNDRIAVTSVGVRGHMKLGRTVLNADLAWQHTWSDNRTSTHVAFSGENPFMIYGSEMNRNAAAVAVGLTVPISDAWNVKVEYDGVIGGEAVSHGGYVMVRYEF
jgi:outer membrane autotransporter protein